ncbi:MAG: hypothetical protein J5842_02420 [Lachnospiraceae bacterium]|nr:hypothetical protein [Lachnospiraceae bacterium]
MKMESFFDMVKEELQRRMGEDVTITLTHVTKNNGIIYDGLSVSRPGSRICPNIYLEHYYDRYMNGESVERIAGEMERLCEDTHVEGLMDLNDFSSLDKISDRIVFRLVNTDKNKGLLEQIPHEPYMDLSMVFCYILPGSEEDGISASVLIRNSHLEMWDTDKEHIKELAMENTPRLLPLSVTKMSNILERIMPCGDALDEMDEQMPMYVVSNTRMINGASVLAYPGAMSDMAEKLGESLYIIPSSIHEVIVMPDKGAMEGLTSMIKEVNETTVDPKETLADHPYYYDIKEDRIMSVFMEKSGYGEK